MFSGNGCSSGGPPPFTVEFPVTVRGRNTRHPISWQLFMFLLFKSDFINGNGHIHGASRRGYLAGTAIESHLSRTKFFLYPLLPRCDQSAFYYRECWYRVASLLLSSWLTCTGCPGAQTNRTLESR